MKFTVKVEAELPTDSANYEVLAEGVRRVAGVEGSTLEIGLRRGGGSKVIIDALVETNQHQSKTHVAIDPYGNIAYRVSDVRSVRYDYTNDMRDECLTNLYLYCRTQKVNFCFLNLEDTEFFKRFADGIPIYSDTKRIVNLYSLVHFDGPHASAALIPEIQFFHERTRPGAVFVFDDVADYDHAAIDLMLQSLGWELYRSTQRKWAYFKK